MVVITPQTISIAVGAALISYVSYRVLLLAIIAVIGACAAYLLARPAPSPPTTRSPAALVIAYDRAWTSSTTPGADRPVAIPARRTLTVVIIVEGR